MPHRSRLTDLHEYFSRFLHVPSFCFSGSQPCFILCIPACTPNERSLRVSMADTNGRARRETCNQPMTGMSAQVTLCISTSRFATELVSMLQKCRYILDAVS